MIPKSYIVCDIDEFLGLSPEEMLIVEENVKKVKIDRLINKLVADANICNSYYNQANATITVGQRTAILRKLEECLSSTMQMIYLLEK